MNNKHISSNGQFASKRAGKSQMWFFKLLFAIILAIVGGGYWIGFTDKPIKNVQRASQGVTKAVIKEVKAEVKPNYEENIKKEKKAILDDLSIGCESKGHSDPDGIIIFDSNNLASIGRFQFQKATVKYYVKVFEQREISDHEAIAIAIDKVKATELAEKILFLDGGKSEKNWYNCDKRMNIGARVQLLKNLMK
jgi:hypothetical protein